MQPSSIEQGDENSGYSAKWWAETSRMINKGAKMFWKKRGYASPPADRGIKFGKGIMRK